MKAGTDRLEEPVAASAAHHGDPQELAADRILSELHGSGALRRGKAHVLSVRAIRQALGARWSERRQVVWDMTEAQIMRRISGSDFCARLSEDAFLIVTPELDPTAAQLLAVRILRDVTTHFLGQVQTRDIAIMEARGYEGERLDCRTLSTDEVERVLKAEQASEEPGGSSRLAAAPPGPGEEPDARLTTFEGRRLRCSVSMSPTIDLSRFAIAGHRIEPKISLEGTDELLPPAARRALMPRDSQMVDLAVLRRGLARLESGQSSTERPSLILAVSFLSLSNTKARNNLLAEIARARDAVAKAVIFEIADFDDGVPASRLAEAAALLKPFCRSVFARVGQMGPFAQNLKALGFAGLTVESPLSGASDEDQCLWLLSMSQGLQTFKGTAIAVNLSSTAALPMAAAVGFTHAAVKM